MRDLVRKEIPNWQSVLNERKLDYLEFLWSQRIAQLIQDGMKMFLQSYQYQPRPIVRESKGYRQLRIKMATDHMKNESEFLNLRAQSYKQNMEALARLIIQQRFLKLMLI